MATSLIKEYASDFDKNKYAEEKSELTGVSLGDAKEDYVLFIGDEDDGKTGSMVKLWSSYQKFGFMCAKAFTEVSEEEVEGATLLFLDSEYLNYDLDAKILYRYASKGVSMVFCNLQEEYDINANDTLKELLGIYAVYADEVTLSGVEFYDGFLLGGESVYAADNLSLKVPWYSVFAGTKTYAAGLLDKDIYGGGVELQNETLPALIWRNSIGDARIFVAAGDYTKDVSALGIYSAMLYEMSDYSLYAVVNAQNFIAANLALYTSEKDEVTQELYSRSQTITYQDLIWPQLAAVYKLSENVPTFFANPKLDYTTDEKPTLAAVEFYHKLFAEVGAESGLTLYQTSDIELSDKLKKDKEIYDSYIPNYSFTALYAESCEEYEKVKDDESIADIRTVCLGEDSYAAPVEYISEGVSAQRATVDGFYHSDSDDLRLKSIETALGYSNILVDLKCVTEPAKEEHWETMADNLSSFTTTYWKNFSAFEKTSATESDTRIRRFLALDYETSRKDDVITLRITDFEEQASFILRTHNETIDSVNGGEWAEIEDGAYLIEADSDTVEIYLK